MIIINGKQYSTLDDKMYYQGNKIVKAYFGSALVYPATNIDIDEIIDAAGGDLSPELLMRVSFFWNTKNPATNIITGEGSAVEGRDMDSYTHIFDLNMTASYQEIGYGTGTSGSSGLLKNGLRYTLDIDNRGGTASSNYGKRDSKGNVIEKGKYPVENHTIAMDSSNSLADGYYLIYPTSYSGNGTIGNYFVNVVWKVWDNQEKTQSHNLRKSYMYVGDIPGHHAVIMVILKVVNGVVTSIIDNGADIYDFIIQHQLGTKLHLSRTIDNTRTTIIYDVTQSDESTEFN